MSVAEHRRASNAGAPPVYAVLTVSDSRDAQSDRGGSRLVELVEGAGCRVALRRRVRDETREIRDVLRQALDSHEIDVVLVTGGTGVAPRDVTIEAVRPLFERELPGFGELFRLLSFAEIGAAAMLSRATAGIAAGKAIFLLPGSPDALELAMTRLVLPEAAHLVAQARRRD